MSDSIPRVAVVTGAGSGIGQAIALGLAEGGATVWGLGRSLASLEAAARVSGTGRLVCAPVDLASDAQVRAVVTRLQEESGGVDVLVHSAGIVALGSVESAPVADLDRQYQVNLRAPYVLTQALLPLIRARRGQIVFINSSAGLVASPGVAQYAATKFGLKALADSLRAEVNAEGIRVVTVFPGRTATPMGEALHAMEGRPYRPDQLAQPGDVAAMVLAALNLPRTAEVTDLTVRPMRKG